MTRFVLIPGAGGAAWYWHRLVPLLEAAGHEAVAVDLPGDDPAAGLPEYAALALAAAGDESDVVIVGQSLGGFTAPLVARDLISAGRPPRELVLLNAMIPSPGETPGAWWDNVGQEAARVQAAEAGGWGLEIDPDAYFLHDVDPVVAASGESHLRPELDIVFGSVCDIETWPAVPTRVIASADDRLFPLELEQRLARERLGVEAVVVPGGHLSALSQPEAIAAALLATP